MPPVRLAAYGVHNLPRPPTHSLADGAAPPEAGPASPLPRPVAFRDHLARWKDTSFLISDDPPPPVRDSIASIVRDPFFQPCRPPAHLNGGAAASRPEPAVHHQTQPTQQTQQPRHDPSPPATWPPPRRESLTATSPTPWVYTCIFFLAEADPDGRKGGGGRRGEPEPEAGQTDGETDRTACMAAGQPPRLTLRPPGLVGTARRADQDGDDQHRRHRRRRRGARRPSSSAPCACPSRPTPTSTASAWTSRASPT